MVKIGTWLKQVKEDLGHGYFLGWVATEFRQWTPRSAQRYMSVATAFAANATCVSYLPQAALVDLAGAPEPAREKVTQRIAAGDPPPPDEVKLIAREARDAVKKETASAKAATMKPDKRAQAKRKQAKAAKEEQEWRERREAKAAATVRLAELIRETVGARLGELIELLDQADLYALKKALKEPDADEISDAV